jgi:hypothetical protein
LATPLWRILIRTSVVSQRRGSSSRRRRRRRRYSIEDIKDLPQVVYPLVGNMNLAGDLQRLYAGAQAGLDCVAHRVAIFRRDQGGERV